MKNNFINKTPFLPYIGLAVLVLVVAFINFQYYYKTSDETPYSVSGKYVGLTKGEIDGQFFLSLIPDGSKEIIKGIVDANTFIYASTLKDGKPSLAPYSSSLVKKGDKITIYSNSQIAGAPSFSITKWVLLK